MEPDAQLQEQVLAAPREPGCYLFRDLDGGVLYVGKAKVLKHRVRSYLRPEADGRLMIPFMVREARSVEFIITASEKEALVLENNLIKIHKPHYNISLRDDRTYVSVRIDLRQPYPRATIVHKYKKDGAHYIGPFSSGSQLRETLEAVKRLFPLRRCSDAVLRNRTRVCVYHDIGICCGPCIKGNVTDEQYRTYTDGLVTLLRGKDMEPLRQIERQMADAAAAQNFELAASLRDQVFAIRATVETQHAQLGGTRLVHRDVIGLHRDGEQALVYVLLYRGDKLVGSTSHQFSSRLPDDELIEQFCARYYEGDRAIPPEVLLPVEIDDEVSLGQYISDKAGFAVTVAWPQRGEKAALIRLANLNARHALADRADKAAATEATLTGLQDALGLENLPRTMECYDISHFQGDEIVGSGVCFKDSKPDKDQYRRYKLKTVTQNDDFASMEEVLTRRLRRGLEEGHFPDLIVIDGGPAQLARVQQVFAALNIIGVDLIGLAKSRDKAGPAHSRNHRSDAPQKTTDERVFLPGNPEPVTLVQNSQEMFLLMRLRDEAHRFAITFQRERRRKVALTSGLDAIPGIGPKRKRALIRALGSPVQVKKASVEQLMAVEGITRAMAEKIVSFFAAQNATPEPAAGQQQAE